MRAREQQRHSTATIAEPRAAIVIAPDMSLRYECACAQWRNLIGKQRHTKHSGNGILIMLISTYCGHPQVNAQGPDMTIQPLDLIESCVESNRLEVRSVLELRLFTGNDRHEVNRACHRHQHVTAVRPFAFRRGAALAAPHRKSVPCQARSSSSRSLNGLQLGLLLFLIAALAAFINLRLAMLGA